MSVTVLLTSRPVLPLMVSGVTLTPLMKPLTGVNVSVEALEPHVQVGVHVKYPP